MKVREFILQSEEIFKNLCEGIDQFEISLRQVEEKILEQINRLGGVAVKPRRCYKYLDHKGGYYPLDEKLGIDG